MTHILLVSANAHNMQVSNISSLQTTSKLFGIIFHENTQQKYAKLLTISALLNPNASGPNIAYTNINITNNN